MVICQYCGTDLRVEFPQFLQHDIAGGAAQAQVGEENIHVNMGHSFQCIVGTGSHTDNLDVRLAFEHGLESHSDNLVIIDNVNTNSGISRHKRDLDASHILAQGGLE